ncbi:MAG: ABC transporter ATP-binding protein [Halobacteriales archaeon]
MSGPADPVVRVEDVRHRFGDVEVLDGVSFSLSPGTLTALVGPNGSGKTTLLRVVAGLLAPSGGRVDRPAGERAVGYLPQHPGFRPAFTVEETLGFYAELLGGADVEAALAAVGLTDVRDRRVDALSGGMVRLLGLAQATLGDPPLAVLDEPTSDLDPGMTARITDAVAERAAGGTAVLLASHDLASVSAADAVLVLDRGAVVARGAPDELCEETETDSLAAAYRALVGDELTVRTGAEP